MFVRALLVLSFLVSLCLGETVNAQLTRKQLLEEIVSAPEDLKGEWKIGEQTFTANDQTMIDDRVLFESGSLAAVLYVEQDGKNVALQIMPLPFKAAEVNDGPYVIWKDEKTAEVITVVEGKVERKTWDNITEPVEVKDLPGPESTIVLDPTPLTPPKSDWEQPSRLMAISDLEGNYKNALQFLKANKVVDEQGNWNWQDGHLVLIGDLIDRGNEVTELMWLLRRLERQANTAGGQVHYVLGNHEAMVMSGDLRYIYPTYHFVSQRVGIPYDQLFSESSDIGRWWRSKNAVMVVGELMFVHGGYSPKLDAAGLDMDTLNQRIRDGLAPAMPTGETAATNPVSHRHGPFWYRGYFDEHAATWGKATPEEVQKILDRHKAKHIVIGHTVVDQVGPLDETGQIIGIDVKWNDPMKGEGLLMEGDKMWRVNMSGEKTELQFGK